MKKVKALNFLVIKFYFNQTITTNVGKRLKINSIMKFYKITSISLFTKKQKAPIHWSNSKESKQISSTAVHSTRNVPGNQRS